METNRECLWNRVYMVSLQPFEQAEVSGTSSKAAPHTALYSNGVWMCFSPLCIINVYVNTDKTFLICLSINWNWNSPTPFLSVCYFTYVLEFSSTIFSEIFLNWNFQEEFLFLIFWSLSRFVQGTAKRRNIRPWGEIPLSTSTISGFLTQGVCLAYVSVLSKACWCFICTLHFWLMVSNPCSAPHGKQSICVSLFSNKYQLTKARAVNSSFQCRIFAAQT